MESQMRGINKVILVGTLGADPEVKYAANGNAIANLSVATSEEWNDKSSGQKQQKTEWHRVAMFGKLAEIAGQYLKKGSQVYLEGKIQTRKWQDQYGLDRYSTEIVISGFDGCMQMVGARNTQEPITRPGIMPTPPVHTQKERNWTTTPLSPETIVPPQPGPPQPKITQPPQPSQNNQNKNNEFDDIDVPW